MVWLVATAPAATSNSPICGRVKLPQLTCAGRGEVTKSLDREGSDLHVSPRTPSDAHRHDDVEVALQSGNRLRGTALALGAFVLHEEVDLVRLARFEELLEVARVEAEGDRVGVVLGGDLPKEGKSGGPRRGARRERQSPSSCCPC